MTRLAACFLALAAAYVIAVWWSLTGPEQARRSLSVSMST